MPQTTDHWLTKAQAAQRLQSSEKHIERLAKRGRLQQAERKEPGKRPMAVFNPDDVGREMQGQNTTLQIKPFIAPDSLAVPAPSGRRDLAALPSPVPQIPAFSVPVQDKLFLTIREAVAYSGLPISYLENLIDTGKLKAVEVGHSGKGVRRRIRKRDLEKL